jgi:hypothetical protein
MIWKLILMIVLGLLSAALTYFNKNYYVRIFDDIVGREEDDRMTVKLGRSFVYGFLFPIYFVLLLWGAVALVAFLVVGGIVAGIAFVLVWATEKIVPHEWLGGIIESLFGRFGTRGAPTRSQAADASAESVPVTPSPEAPAPEPAKPPGDQPKTPPAGEAKQDPGPQA